MILFRCGADPKIGFGHLVRCRALGSALAANGKSCLMVGPEEKFATSDDRKIFDDWIPLAFANETLDAKKVGAIGRQFDVEAFVLDHYPCKSKHQKTLATFGGKLCKFESEVDSPVWADIVLNPNPVASAGDYRDLRNPSTKFLTGPRYAILRPEFKTIVPRAPERPIRNVLLTFGGGDDRGAIEFVLSTLLPVADRQINFQIVSGQHNPRNSTLEKWLKETGQTRVTLIVNPVSISARFLEADLAIMAAGSSVYELAACGVPMIVMSLADNQIKHAEAWAKTKGVLNLGELKQISKNQLQDAFVRISQDVKSRAALAIQARTMCDARGAERVASELIGVCHAG